jgi:hypothetical protein
MMPIPVVIIPATANAAFFPKLRLDNEYLPPSDHTLISAVSLNNRALLPQDMTYFLDC